LAIIWCSFLWAIWRSRNERVFNNKEVDMRDIIEQVKFQSWNWFIGRVAKFPCLLYEWNWSPLDCFMRWSTWLVLVWLWTGLCCVASGLLAGRVVWVGGGGFSSLFISFPLLVFAPDV
jgi:hypothetical protein